MKGALADEIFSALPVIPPTVTEGVVYPYKTANAGYDAPHFYTMEPSLFNGLQQFKWHQIFNITGATRQAVQQTGKDAKRKARDAKWQKKVELTARIEGRKGFAGSSLQPPQ